MPVIVDGLREIMHNYIYDFLGLFVYVDVRSGADGCENRSAAISHQLTNLGATVN